MRISDRVLPSVVLGVDPGARSSGLVVRRHDELLAATVIHRPKAETLQTFGHRVTAAAEALKDEYAPSVLAFEGLTVPNSHMGRGTAQVRAYGETQRIIGHLEALGWDWIVVAPRGNGSQPWQTYPDALFTKREHPREGGKGTGKLRHARSAWDVAGKAMARAAQP